MFSQLLSRKSNSVQYIDLWRPFYNDSRGIQEGNLCTSQGGLFGLSPLRSDGSQDGQMRRLSCVSSGQKQLKGGHQAPVYSDHMVLMMARQGGWTAVMKWPKTLKSKLNLKGDY
jgi:hypothetical protein